LGIWNVDGMLRRMSSRALTEWMAYYNLEPFGDEVLDIHLSNLTAAVTNANRTKGSASQPKEFRLWKEFKKFDPQEFFNNLKSALNKDK
jgi:hypothetical protein